MPRSRHKFPALLSHQGLGEIPMRARPHLAALDARDAEIVTILVGTLMWVDGGGGGVEIYVVAYMMDFFVMTAGLPWAVFIVPVEYCALDGEVFVRVVLAGWVGPFAAEAFGGFGHGPFGRVEVALLRGRFASEISRGVQRVGLHYFWWWQRWRWRWWR